MRMNIALILSGGTGSRIQSDVPKQYMAVSGRMIVTRCLEVFLEHPEIDAIQVVAAVDWSEAILDECEMIPDADREISIWTKPMTGGEEVQHILRLTHFPDRPPRASRLKMTLYFTSNDCCTLEVEDLGFGGFFRSSGQKWSRKIYFG